MNKFPLRGVVEGFYGTFYTQPERIDLIRFLGQQDYNLYLYAPKNDRQHRARWREAYPAKVMDQFAQTVDAARESGVNFCYSVAPGVSISYASEEDFEAITRKFRAFYDIGVRAFSLLLDDIDSDFQHDADRLRYATYADAHADLCNRVYAWLQALDPACTLSMCPTDYWGAAPFSDYIHTLGARLDRAIDVFYTGRDICVPEISAEDVTAFAAATNRPPLIWDNYPVNDLSMQHEMHIGAVAGRDPALVGSVRGILINTMIQPEASKIALMTYADFLRDPAGYDADASWTNAMQAIAGDAADSLRLFSENSLYSCLGRPEAKPLQMRVDDLMASLLRREGVIGSPAAEALNAYLTALDEANYVLKFRMDNLKLRHELIPWIEKLDLWIWLGRFALQTLEALERRQPYEKPLAMMKEWRDAALAHPKRVGGRALIALTDFTLERVAALAEKEAQTRDAG